MFSIVWRRGNLLAASAGSRSQVIATAMRSMCTASASGPAEVFAAAETAEIAETAETAETAVPVEGTKDTERLTKFIANSGYCSRHGAEQLIRDGKVELNGQVVTKVSQLVSTKSRVSVVVDGLKIGRNMSIATPRLWAIWKNDGELVAERDLKNRPLLMDRLRNHMPSGVKTLFPVCRLDFTTQGLCLFTNHGGFSQALNSSSSNLTREYRARINGVLSPEKIESLKKGVYIDGKRAPSISIVVERTAKTISWVKITTNDSSNRSVVNSLRQMHLNVTRMISTGFGPFKASMIPDNFKGLVELKIPSEIRKLYAKKFLTPV